MVELKGQHCSFCNENKLVLREEQMDIPHFGKVFILTMECEGCGYKKADVEPAEKKEPCKFTLDITAEADMSIKIVKSGDATVKIPHIITMEPGPASEGYITNIEGLLERVKGIIQMSIDTGDEDEDNSAEKKKAKNLIKKLDNVILGRDTLKLIIEDPNGHSAIISEKAVRSRI
ncbi:ZPR1 zinc finger domain-containing protein [Candidatus Woesearchaeota archaeon]|nr:ZPR1 zinc finger domain-containing protein [Candidatus Woesearchaeota archaeon]